MSQVVRQSELFAGNDWTVLYQAFSNINFNAFDFNTIRSAMTDYIQQNYPGQFNDWISSSEFVALLDLLAYLGQSLAFRMDVNSRENFIDIARREESVLRLARFLSYNPRRNQCAKGLAKIVSIQTTDNITDSFGNDLSGKTITWNDSSNQQWQDQWFNVLKEVFIDTNSFGLPLQETPVGNVPTQLYRLKNTPVNAGTFPFQISINNNTLPCEVVNMNFDGTNGFYEVEPDLQSSLNLCYRNDSNGNDSKDTGFFVLFKQGTLQTYDWNITTPISNLTVTLDAKNINDSDVWVQSVNDAGYKVTGGSWTKVGYVPSEDMSKVIVSSDNITYNSVDSDVRNIFQANTLAGNRVSLRFGNGQFGTAPSGNLRAWFRVSEDSSYTIKPENLRNIPISFTYQNNVGASQTLTITLSLQENVENATESETLDQIRQRAPSVYNTQGRMVSGSDYNTLPSTNNVALKVKAVNRTYSGQSRYLDLNDPTGTYQSTNIFADDGILFSEDYSGYNEIPTSLNYTASNIITNFIEPMLQESYVRDALYSDWTNNKKYGFDISNDLYWNQSTTANFSSTGVFSSDNAGKNLVSIGSNAVLGTTESYLLPNSIVKFKLPDGTEKWATIASIDELGSTHLTTVSTNSSSTIGPIKLNQNIPQGSKAIKVIPCFRYNLNTAEVNNFISAINAKRTFACGFDYKNQNWYIIDGLDISNSEYDYFSKGTSSDSSWIVKVEYSPLYWRITTRGKSYVFESENDVKFFFVDTYKSIDPQTGRLGSDELKLLKYNFITNANGSGKPSDVSFKISGTYSYSDGTVEPKRILVTFADSDSNGQPDNPESFLNVIEQVTGNSSLNDQLVFHSLSQDSNGYDVWSIDNSVTIAGKKPDTISGTVYVPGDNPEDGTFYVPANDSVTNHSVNTGVKDLSFQWKHYAPSNHRIDPSITNIIDIFVLTNSYYNDMQAWLSAGLDPLNIPDTPSEADLQSSYEDLENYKMFSDEMVWRPVKFKLIGGANSSPNLKFSLKVVKLADSLISDGEIKTNLINAVRYYFDVTNWDFGETFYASELIAFIHQQLIEGISSVTLVPQSSDQNFGDLFQITCMPDELFFCTLQVSDIQIVPQLTSSNLRIG